MKSLRQGKANQKDSYAALTKSGEVYLYNLHISPYEHGNRFNVDPLRDRNLLMHKREIQKLIGKTREKGFTLVPLQLYFNHGLVKCKLALATGKKLYDKRDADAQRSAKREIDRTIKEKNY